MHLKQNKEYKDIISKIEDRELSKKYFSNLKKEINRKKIDLDPSKKEFHIN
jgi:hypothetical protein